jgi:NADPH-dependent 2,4-dienoyl-CoA reductase/sulfur reductase-like enzyme
MREVQYLVIGGGIAGGKALEGVREVDPDGSLALITRENHPPYHKPPLSKDYLREEADLEDVYLKTEEAYQDLDVDLILGREAVEIDPENKTVTLEDGEEIKYDRLTLATGGSANKLPLWGSELERVFTLRSIEDSQRIREAAGPNTRALVMGGSFIGAEVTASLSQMGCQVVEIFPESRLLEHIAPEALSARLTRMLEEQDIRVLPGTVAESLEGEQTVRRAVLDNGERLDLDFVVMGVGISLNTKIAEAAGIEVRQDGSVVVDDKLRTNQPAIYAAGDVTAFPGEYQDGMLHVEHWDVARGQGLTAGRNMAGADEAYTELPYFFSDILDFSFEVWGELTGWEDAVLRGSLEDNSFAYYFFRDGKLAGVLASGRPDEEREAMQTLPRQRPAQDQVADVLADEGADLDQLLE